MLTHDGMVEFSERIQRAGGTTDPLETCNILSYELGDITKCLIYAKYRKKDTKGLYLAEARLAMADLLFQARLLCITLGFPFQSTLESGEERCSERMDELESGAL